MTLFSLPLLLLASSPSFAQCEGSAREVARSIGEMNGADVQSVSKANLREEAMEIFTVKVSNETNDFKYRMKIFIDGNGPCNLVSVYSIK